MRNPARVGKAGDGTKLVILALSQPPLVTQSQRPTSFLLLREFCWGTDFRLSSHALLLLPSLRMPPQGKRSCNAIGQDLDSRGNMKERSSCTLVHHQPQGLPASSWTHEAGPSFCVSRGDSKQTRRAAKISGALSSGPQIG